MAFHEFFEIDSETGFLTPKKSAKLKNPFTAPQKVLFLEAFRKSGNFGKAAKLIGVLSSTVRDHLAGDEKFKQAHRQVIDDICDDMEEALIAIAHRNPTAAFGVLRAYRGHIWKDNYKENGPNKSERLNQLIKDIKSQEKE